MNLHILGICGTFMGGLALLARELGHRVSGQDQQVYPPMSTQLAEQGITLIEGFSTEDIPADTDRVIIGNALSRGNPAVEFILNRRIPYTSGPQWLSENLLRERWVIAVAGTHGKTSTASMIATILEECGLEPGFLIGGVPHNFGLSARLGSAPFFVIEADEYDTAFFDKRSKFLHYLPQGLVLNNLEYDHADIFPDLAAIQHQFHHLIRTVPSGGKIFLPSHVSALNEVVEMGCWTPLEYLGDPGGWQAEKLDADGHHFQVGFSGNIEGAIDWDLIGDHNIANALAALAAAHHAGVTITDAIIALNAFKGVKRRLELRGRVADIRVYDDFAHHPTAITTTLQGVRRSVGQARIIAVMEPRSNTMRQGVHRETLAASLKEADLSYIYSKSPLTWLDTNATHIKTFQDFEILVSDIVNSAMAGDHIVVMSNGGFEQIHQRLLTELGRKFNEP